VVFTVAGRVCDCRFAFVDGGVAHILGVVDAAEELVGLSVAGLRGKERLKHCGGFIHATLLEHGVGLRVVGHKKARCEKKN
jgi:hypothetical protein